jgi:hypothetical protein
MVKNIVWPAKQGRLKVDYTTCADSHQMLSERSICHRVKTKSTSNQFRLESCFVGLFKKWEIHQHIHHILCKGEWSALRFWRRHNRWRKSRLRVNRAWSYSIFVVLTAGIRRSEGEAQKVPPGDPDIANKDVGPLNRQQNPTKSSNISNILSELSRSWS